MNYKVVKKDELLDCSVDKYVCFYDYYSFKEKFGFSRYADSNKANNDYYLKKIFSFSYRLGDKVSNRLDPTKVFPFYFDLKDENGFLGGMESNEFATNIFGWGNVNALENLFLLLSNERDVQTIAFPTVTELNDYYSEFDAYAMLIYRLAMKFSRKTWKTILFVADNDKAYKRYEKTIAIIHDYEHLKKDGISTLKWHLYLLEESASGVTDMTVTSKQSATSRLIPCDTYFDIAIKNQMTVDKEHKMLCMRDKLTTNSKWIIPYEKWKTNLEDNEQFDYYVDDGIYYDQIERFKNEYGIQLEYIGWGSYHAINDHQMVQIGVFNLKSENLPENDRYEFRMCSLKEILAMDFEEQSKEVVKRSY